MKHVQKDFEVDACSPAALGAPFWRRLPAARLPPLANCASCHGTAPVWMDEWMDVWMEFDLLVTICLPLLFLCARARVCVCVCVSLSLF